MKASKGSDATQETQECPHAPHKRRRFLDVVSGEHFLAKLPSLILEDNVAGVAEKSACMSSTY
jgi:hypothetical protein